MAQRIKTVTVKIDTSGFERACRVALQAVAEMQRVVARAGRVIARARWTAGDRHIERIMRDCIDRRLDVDTTARRLMVASDIGAVIDKQQLDEGRQA